MCGMFRGFMLGSPFILSDRGRRSSTGVLCVEWACDFQTARKGEIVRNQNERNKRTTAQPGLAGNNRSFAQHGGNNSVEPIHDEEAVKGNKNGRFLPQRK